MGVGSGRVLPGPAQILALATGHPRAAPDKTPWAASGSLCVLYIWRDSSSSSITAGLGRFRPQETRLKAESVHKCGRLAENPILPVESLKAPKTDVGSPWRWQYAGQRLPGHDRSSPQELLLVSSPA